MRFTREQLEERTLIRRRTFEVASEMVTPIVDGRGFKAYPMGEPGGIQSVVTEVDQHLEAIIKVANWLIEDVE